MKTIVFSLSLLVASVTTINAQRTVGLFHTSDSAYSGYTIFGPKRSEITYLIDNCGDLQYTWNSPYKSGGSVQLLDDGLLLRTCVYQMAHQSTVAVLAEKLLPSNPIS
ncbi:MAG: hypothetical protein JKY54_10685 [Flavobacteriales bacterium]|nr:hypothetical protein [Flavobacteriales bacterium]